MSLRKEILEKIPDDLKREPEVKTLLEHIELQKLKTKEELQAYLQREIREMERWIKEHKQDGETRVKEVRDKALRLGIFRKCEEITRNFL